MSRALPVKFATALVVMLATATLGLPQGARADDPPLYSDQVRAGTMTPEAALQRLAEQAQQLIANCEIAALDRFFRDADALPRSVEQRHLMNPEFKIRARDLRPRVERSCSSKSLAERIEDSAEYCEIDSARETLARLERLADHFSGQRDAARAGDWGASREVDLLVAWSRRAQDDLTRARNLYDDYSRQCRERQKNGEPLPRRMLGNALVPTDPANSCRQPRGEEPVARCNPFAVLIGRWESPDGGVLETWLETGGTISGRIAVATPYMRARGFGDGMLVLRGYVPKVSTSTWIVQADGGEYFIAAQPDRKPGEMYGEPTWVKGHGIHLEDKNPGRLMIPASLEGRISNYKPWMRVDPIASRLDEIQNRTRPPDEPGKIEVDVEELLIEKPRPAATPTKPG